MNRITSHGILLNEFLGSHTAYPDQMSAVTSRCENALGTLESAISHRTLVAPTPEDISELHCNLLAKQDSEPAKALQSTIQYWTKYEALAKAAKAVASCLKENLISPIVRGFDANTKAPDGKGLALLNPLIPKRLKDQFNLSLA